VQDGVLLQLNSLSANEEHLLMQVRLALIPLWRTGRNPNPILPMKNLPFETLNLITHDLVHLLCGCPSLTSIFFDTWYRVQVAYSSWQSQKKVINSW
jgi:hypothetical protein